MTGVRESKPNSTRLFRAALLGPGLVVALLWAWASETHAADCPAPLAQLVLVKGSVELVRTGTQRLVVAESNAGLCAGDTVVVHERSQAALLLANATVVRLDQGTTVTISPSTPGRPALLSVISGAIYVISRTPQPFRVRTPFINANVEGTEFLVEVRRGPGNSGAKDCPTEPGQPAETDRITVYEGSVRVDASPGPFVLAAGETAVATAAQSPTKVLTVRPRDAVTWTLYVPTIVRSERVVPAAFGCATQLMAQGSLAPAKTELNRLLAAKGSADDAVVYALLATIAVAENERAQATTYSDRAVELNAKSAPAWLARSYAQQALFRIEDALASADRAVDLEPTNALAVARRAELQMSVGRLDAALASAREAVRLDPQVARTQTVLGFANLTRIDLKAARASFEQAIALDATDPLPRLGLGLVSIRAGDVVAGRVDIEVAAILDPTQSLVRSYLGKAYFDERRGKLAQSQFKLAKELDPNDPTPWFYDAVRGQTSNEPGQALDDMQRSIEKNANRAVFRSKLLLDDDLAARSISQASIYRQLGFEQLALFEAYKALAADPLNFSAHRFLAEAYVERPRHQFARENEALQAQMLQPISLYPLQLPLTATEAGSFGTSVLFDPGFSEYNRLYVRNGLNGQVLGFIGGRGTRADQLLVSGVNDALSYSLGQFHYESDGFRSNTQSRKDLYDLFVQFTPNEGTSVHLEWRQVRLNEGDLSLRFDPDFTTDFRYGQKKELTRLGARQRLGENTTLLLSLATQGSHDTTDSETFGGRLFSSDRRDKLGELQVAHQAGRLHLRAGVGFLAGKEDTDNQGTLDSHKQRSHNAYVYATLGELPGGIRIDGGISRDYINDPTLTRSLAQNNYKAGLGWNVNADTTLRFAAFRMLKRTGLAELTIEPTQVMGFNQFFDDFNGTSARRVAAALDHKFSNTAFAGIELTRRDLKVVQSFSDPLAIFDWHERSHSAYLSLLPRPGLAINVAYRYEDIRRVPDLSGVDDFIRARTQRLPVTFSLTTSPSSSVRVRVTPVHQTGTFLHSDFSAFDGDSTFAVVDAAVTYHFPKRYGTLTGGVQNLFDRRARFQETDISAPTLTPQRFFFVRLSSAF